MDEQSRKLLQIVKALGEMIDRKKCDVQLLKQHQPPNQRLIEITKGELDAMTQVWNMIGETVAGRRG